MSVVDPRGDTSTRRRLESYAGGESTNSISLSGDRKIASGQITGLERAEQLYGMNMMETGDAAKSIIERRRKALSGKDPASTRLRQSRNRRSRMAKAGGASGEELRQIEREAEFDIANQDFSSQEKALSQYQKLIGNVIGGTSSMEMGFAGLEKAGENVEYRPPSMGMFGSVICTELYRQGYMSNEILIKDTTYGARVRLNDPNVYFGYLSLAAPVVRLMKTSKVFTYLVSIPGMAWAKNMAGDKNVLGNLISKIGEPVCRFVGSIQGEFREKDYYKKRI